MLFASFTSRFAALAIGAACWAGAMLAHAVALPERAELQKQLGRSPLDVRVVEPHLSTKDKLTTLVYRGFPANLVLERLLGPGWKQPGLEIEFRALDGYVSRIPAERFSRYKAYLVFERRGQKEFAVDNLAQNEKRVPLGPYYLVWDNRAAPELVEEGGTFWPYQVAQILLSSSRLEALLPGDMRNGFAEQASLAQKYCLSCHQVNGYGGEKWPINLAGSVKAMDEAAFSRWVLTPSQVKPGTTMPGLPERMPEPQKRELVKKLYAYLRAVPATK